MNTVSREIDRITIRVPSLRDLIMAKRAAGRPKDLEALAELESMLQLELGDG